MENYFGFDHHQHTHVLSCDPSFSGFPFDNSYLNTDTLLWNPHTVEDFMTRNLPLFHVSSSQQLKASEPNNSCNWFHLKPNSHRAVARVPNSPARLLDLGEQRGPMISGQRAQKRFLVFDQSGDKTTLLYSSGHHAHIQFGAYPAPDPPTIYNQVKEQRDTNNRSKDESVENYSREDTDELDALLCSSDEDSDFSEDDETSTGHSPSTVTDSGPPKSEEETGEEVNSFLVPIKRQKLWDGGYHVPSPKTITCSSLESDAESSCGNESKRPRKAKIHETVRILQSIVPNANAKDPIVIIDEAIRYLKSLKAEAEASGLDTI